MAEQTVTYLIGKDGKITVDGSSIVGWGDQGSVDDEIIL